MLDNSDSQSFEEVQQFQIHFAEQVQNRKPLPYQEILDECEQLKKDLLTARISKTVDKIVELCSNNLAESKSIIIPVKFEINQKGNLKQFLDILYFQLESGSNLEQHFTKKIEVHQIQQSQIRNFILNVYLDLDNKTQDSYDIFIAQEITDLDQGNIYCFEKCLKNKHYFVIVPTYNILDNDNEYGVQGVQFQKLFVTLYDSKNLFTDFMYECMLNSKIKAYLPQQIVSLISDFDYYPISYNEGARRLIFCIQRYHMLHPKQNIYVDFRQLVQIIKKVVALEFSLFSSDYLNEFILRCVYSERDKFRISEKYFVSKLQLEQHYKKIEEEDIIDSIEGSLKYKLSKIPNLKEYVSYFQEEDEQEPQGEVKKTKKSKDRVKQLGIPNKKQLSPKAILENQISQIIKKATLLVRKQAKEVKWADIKFEQRIKPQIPYLIMEAAANSEENKELIEEVRGFISVPLSRVVNKFGVENIGELTYAIRNLQINGVIDIHKKMIKPSISTNYFQKANFSEMRRNK